MTAAPLLIVADDLTGACDTAGAAAGLVGPVTVHLRRRRAASPPAADRVVAVDLDSRSAPVAAAVARTVEAVAVAPGDVYLKIDSTLRGHVVATVGAAAGAFRARHPDARVLVCPAFPARGRTVRGRRVWVDRHALPSTVLDELAAMAGVEVADAETDSDLAAVVGAVAGDRPTLWIGSAGLVPHVVRRVAARPPGSAQPPHDDGPPVATTVAVVVGSEQLASVAGATALETRCDPGVRVLTGDPRRPDVIDAAVELAGTADALVATGGYTARRVLDALGIGALRVRGELEPGIPWATTGATPETVVTKAGGFGDAGTLGRLVDRLRTGPQSA